MSLALQRGVKFALGTDLNHGMLWKEAYYFAKELGASNAEAIKAITINGAALCGVAGSTGTLETGKRADMVAVEGDPLKDISCLKNVRMVIKDGRPVSNAH